MVKKICNLLSTVLLIIMVAIAGALLLPYVFGYQPLAVLSGSMEPDYHVGSVIYVKEASPEDLKIGDAITFRLSDNTYATHYLISIDMEKREFVTQGKANANDDGARSFDTLVGRASKFSIPYLGYISLNMRTPLGILSAVGVIVVILLLNFIPDLFTKDEEEVVPQGPDDPENK